MNKEHALMSLLFPMLAVLTVVAFLGIVGGGFIFVTLNMDFGEWPVVIIGTALVFAVPVAAYLLERTIAKE